MFRLRHASVTLKRTGSSDIRRFSSRPSASLPPAPPNPPTPPSNAGAYPQELAKAILRIGLIYTTFIVSMEINPDIGSYVKEKAPNIYSFTKPSRDLFNSARGGGSKEDAPKTSTTKELFGNSPVRSDSGPSKVEISSKPAAISTSTSAVATEGGSGAKGSTAYSQPASSDNFNKAREGAKRELATECPPIFYDYNYSSVDAVQYPSVSPEKPVGKDKAPASEAIGSKATVIAAPTPSSAAAIDNNKAVDTNSKSLLPTTSAERQLTSVQSQSAATGVMAQHTSEIATLKKELEASLVGDLQSLDEMALRTRIVQLTEVMFERTKWEGIRMSQALKQIESELSRKYMDLMTNQRAELELEVNKISSIDKQASMDQLLALTEKSMVEYEKKLQAALREYSTSFQPTRSDRLVANEKAIVDNAKDEANFLVAEMRKAQVDELVNFQNSIEIAKGQLRAFDKNIKESINSSDVSKHNHDESAALFILETVLSTAEPLGPYVDGLKEAVSKDELITAVIASIPREALIHGVLSEASLRQKFAIARAEVRKVSLTPRDVPSVIGHVIGSTLASLSPLPKGMVQGDGADERLSRAQLYMDNGMLSDALTEVDKIEGYERIQLRDWEVEARRRLQLNQAVKVVKAASVLKHKMYN